MHWRNLYWIAPAALAAVISAPAIGQDRQADPDRRYEQDHREQRDQRDQDRNYRRSENLEVRYATIAPPRRHRERRTERPDADAVWVAGYWDWQGAQWAWVPGRWDHPENRGAWVQPRYMREGDGYRYEPGHWSSQRVIEGEQYRQEREHRRDREHRDEDRDRNQ